MKISALSSGSSGNCFYVENEKNEKAVLIDCGISCRKIEERLQNIKRNAEKIKAIFITHEHSDHIRGIDVFARKFNVPIYAPRKIAKSIFLCSDNGLINGISNKETLKIAGMAISAFPKSHLSIDPVSYSITDKNKKLSLITDAGHCCKKIIENVSDADFLCLESNYDQKMLEEGFYPWPTKQWIKSDNGHLSNEQSASCVLEHANNKLKRLMLCHISQNNNTPEKALEIHSYFYKQREKFNPAISLSLKSSATPLFKV